MLSLSFVHPSGLGSNTGKISLEEKFHFWLQEKASEGENGVTVLDEGGAGVIHLAAGLGYDWAIETLIVDAKIDINFNDKNGCTALHWAAYCGRKNTVEFLISKDAAHALPSFPPGSGENTPANLAFATGHQEIGHYLEEKVELSWI
ncbi:calmodulin-binding transcription activator 3-like isoform X1 [Mangifera indica]|uniref:calmodulin-binding transcription activator 3-like isoform X1 n=1 Tax=Mangifera indica TaxID=29780 RepID=UPI001CF9ED29|nr:calmodulin-binding transcription activator 3-like isoform X1 [Mangifera indica]